MLPQITIRLAFALAAATAVACVAAPEPAEPLKVMLQGQSTAALERLVEDHGGTVTHSLHIINAVGALLTREQLEKALDSPLIIRYLDDLSISEQPEENPADATDACNARGSLELQLTHDTVTWRLFNKQDTPLPLSGLELAWPAELGPLTALSLGGQPIAHKQDKMADPGKLSLSFEPKSAPVLSTHANLTLHFEPSTNSELLPALNQRQFNFEAKFASDCSTKLIPGYDNNETDSYYPSVVGADALHQLGVTGSGVTVAILDSGLWEHPALAHNTHGDKRVIARFDAITNTAGKEVFDESGHGTHLASALANNRPVTRDGRPTGHFKGIAPDVNLVAVKAFNERGQGGFLDIVRGVQWIVDHRQTYNIKVLNLSFAALPRWHYWEDPINQAVMRAWASGITVVAAAGNEGPDPMTVGSPGNLPYIITVGAVTDSWTPGDRDDDYIPDFSSRGPTPSAHIKPDVVAPGGHIIGITRPGSTLTRDHPDYLLSNGELVMTGTSQAAAVVSGVVALLLQLNPELTPDDLKCMLTSSAELAINRDGLLAYTPFQQGSGYVSAIRAVTLGQRGCANTDLNIAQDMAGTEHFQGPAIVDESGDVSLPGLHLMVSPEEPAKGTSKSRKWGVKEHIERDVTPNDSNSNERTPFNWEERYLEEKKLIEQWIRPPE